MTICGRADFQRTAIAVADPQAFHRTLIYSGRHGQKVNVGYREFSNDLARPAFTNAVEYDLSRSRIIGYKGARIEIVGISNEAIRYRVLNGFGKQSRAGTSSGRRASTPAAPLR